MSSAKFTSKHKVDTKFPGTQVNKKFSKKNADALVENAVAIQKKAVAESSNAKANLLFIEAGSLFIKALDAFPNHADALYGQGVLVLEKLEFMLGNNESFNVSIEVQRALHIFQTVIRNDTSGRGETTGLAHRASANAITQYVDYLSNWKVVNKEADRTPCIHALFSLMKQCEAHYNAVCSILSGDKYLDQYLVDFAGNMQNGLRLLDEVPWRSEPYAGMLLDVFRQRCYYCSYIQHVLQTVALQSAFSNNKDGEMLSLQMGCWVDLLEFRMEYQGCWDPTDPQQGGMLPVLQSVVGLMQKVHPILRDLMTHQAVSPATAEDIPLLTSFTALGITVAKHQHWVQSTTDRADALLSLVNCGDIYAAVLPVHQFLLAYTPHLDAYMGCSDCLMHLHSHLGAGGRLPGTPG